MVNRSVGLSIAAASSRARMKAALRFLGAETPGKHERLAQVGL
jgi:hypothetical protein